MMQPKGKHARPQNTSSVKQLFKIAFTVHTLYHPSEGPLYLQYTSCTARRRGVKQRVYELPMLPSCQGVDSYRIFMNTVTEEEYTRKNTFCNKYEGSPQSRFQMSKFNDSDVSKTHHTAACSRWHGEVKKKAP